MVGLHKDKQWLTENCDAGGTALSYEIEGLEFKQKTDYQLVEVYKTKQHGYLMLLDGFIQLTTRDNFIYHEMLTHPALFSHPDPQRVAIIGGGDCGSLREVLKHPNVKQAWQIEIDQVVTECAQRYFPELCVSNDDSRAELIFGDGIAWIKAAQDNSLDVIIIDSTDPIGPAEGLFTEAFYKECLRVLTPEGVIIQQSESPLYDRDSIIFPIHKALRGAGFDNTKSLYFSQPCYPSGWWSATLASNRSDFWLPREQSVNTRAFKTVYYNLDMHKAAFAQPQFMAEQLVTLLHK